MSFSSVSMSSLSANSTPTTSPQERQARDNTIQMLLKKQVPQNLKPEIRESLKNDHALLASIEKDFTPIITASPLTLGNSITAHYSNNIIFHKPLKVDDILIYDNYAAYYNAVSIEKNKATSVTYKRSTGQLAAADSLKLLGIIRKSNHTAYERMQSYLDSYYGQNSARSSSYRLGGTSRWKK